MVITRTHRLYTAFYFALATGLRHGEVLGLRWRDIQGDTLHVQQTIVKAGGGYAFSTPKTAHGVWCIILDPEALATLELHSMKQACEARALDNSWHEEKHLGLVFTSETGTPLHPRNFDRTWYMLQANTRIAYIASGQSEQEKKLRAKQIDEGKVLPRIRFHEPDTCMFYSPTKQALTIAPSQTASVCSMRSLPSNATPTS